MTERLYSRPSNELLEKMSKEADMIEVVGIKPDAPTTNVTVQFTFYGRGPTKTMKELRNLLNASESCHSDLCLCLETTRKPEKR